MGSILLRVGVIGAIIIGAIILRPFLSGNAGNLQVGDCFDIPADATDVVDDVQHHPCTDPHQGEVIFVGNYESPNDVYPSEDDFDAYVTQYCIPAFQTYTGIDYYADETYGIGSFFPTSEGWAEDDHEVSCYVGRVDNQMLTQSVKKAQ